MLVLSRREGERIVIDGPCVIEVVRIGPPGSGNVRLGITAGQEVTILREELADVSKSITDLRYVGGLVSDPHIPVIHVAEASGDVGSVVREDGEE
jgi:carbon storage regulator CsrA